MREARLQPSLHVEGAPESASQSAARAAVKEAVQRLLFSTPGASLPNFIVPQEGSYTALTLQAVVSE